MSWLGGSSGLLRAGIKVVDKASESESQDGENLFTQPAVVSCCPIAGWLVTDRHWVGGPALLPVSTLFSPLYSPGPFPKQKDIILDSRFVYVAHRSQALRRLQNKPFIC